jgi:hypothetical protein
MAQVNHPVHQRHLIHVEEDVGALRRAVAELVTDMPSLRDSDAGLVATELGTNLLRHTDNGGYVLYRGLADGLELLAVDGGPGLRDEDVPPDPDPDPEHLLTQGPPPRPTGLRESRDGTRGLGAGLNTVRRRSVDFDWYATEAGTAVLARLGAPTSTRTACWRWGGVNVPLGGSGVSGDGWAVDVERRLVALVVDGLGHGVQAAAATEVALAEFERWSMTDPESFVGRVHKSMLSTRGGVLGLCVLDQQSAELTFVGVGNVHGRVFCNEGSHRLLSRVGVLGTEIPVPDMQLATGEWKPGATLMLATDGIKAHWEQSQYPDLLEHDPTLIAAVIQRDHSEGNDDAALLVVRDLRNPAGE